MDASEEFIRGEEKSPSPRSLGRSRRVAWAVGLLIAAAVTALAFAAYRQPDLLLNLVGLRYCG